MVGKPLPPPSSHWLRRPISLIWPDLIWPDLIESVRSDLHLIWSDRILSDFLSQLGFKNPPKAKKVFATTPSHAGLIFWWIFHWFLMDLGSPEEENFIKIVRITTPAGFFSERSWGQLGPILCYKIQKNPNKKRSKEASTFQSIFRSSFFFDLGSNLDALTLWLICQPHWNYVKIINSIEKVQSKSMPKKPSMKKVHMFVP